MSPPRWRIATSILLLVLDVGQATAWNIEGRVKGGTQGYFESPPFHKDFDSEAELRLGVLGDFWKSDPWKLDFELSADAKQVDGPSEQAHFARETDVDFFRAWLRLDHGNFKIRGGRQKILFGSGFVFRPLGFFDTRDVTGVVPETRGVDGVRTTYFFDETTSVESWLVPAKRNESVVWGMRGEALLGNVETGAVIQYHPKTDLEELADFNQDMWQAGFYFKGEKAVGYWNESRLDVENNRGNHPVRFDTVFGVDYTFDVGEGLHVLTEYFLSVRERQFTQTDLQGDRTVQQLAVLLDQPVGIDVKWQVFGIYDLKDRSFQLIPQIEYYLARQTYLYLHGRWGASLREGEKKGRLFRKSRVFNGTESMLGLAVVIYF